MQLSKEENYQLNCLHQPTKREALISFALPEKSRVILKITNQADSEVRMLLNETLLSDDYKIPFPYGHLSEGDYCVKLIVQTEHIIDINSINIQIPKHEIL